MVVYVVAYCANCCMEQWPKGLLLYGPPGTGKVQKSAQFFLVQNSTVSGLSAQGCMVRVLEKLVSHRLPVEAFVPKLNWDV